jgi:hypothetical protein
MRLHKVLSIVAVSVSILSAAPAWAGFAQGNQVTMGGQPVFAIAGSADGYSPDHRAWLSQDALDNALVVAGNKTASAVTVARQNGAVIVALDGRRVATADSNSARLEGLTANQLANKWADGIRSFLNDQSRTVAYLGELTGRNPVNATVAIAERRIFMPPGTVLPVAFAMPISSENLVAGQAIEGTLTQDMVFGNYALPAKSTVLGAVQEIGPGSYSLAFNTLRTPTGTVVPISAVLSGSLTGTGAPHLVATLAMPYGDYPRYQGVAETACRTPAQIGIGATGGTERLVLRKGTNLVFAPGTPMSVVFQAPQQVAVVLRTTM